MHGIGYKKVCETTYTTGPTPPVKTKSVNCDVDRPCRIVCDAQYTHPWGTGSMLDARNIDVLIGWIFLNYFDN